MIQFVRFIAAFIIYAVIDIAWNFSPIAVGMYARFHEASGSPLSDIQRDNLNGIGFIIAGIIFFALIAYANSRFAIEPAIRERSIRLAMVNSAVLGCAAYATYIVPVFPDYTRLAGGACSHRHHHRRSAEPDNIHNRGRRRPAPAKGLTRPRRF